MNTQKPTCTMERIHSMATFAVSGTGLSANTCQKDSKGRFLVPARIESSIIYYFDLKINKFR